MWRKLKGFTTLKALRHPQGSFTNSMRRDFSGWSEELRTLNLHGLHVLHGITAVTWSWALVVLPALATFSMFRSSGVSGSQSRLAAAAVLSRDRINSLTLPLSIRVAPVSTSVGIGAKGS